jgi:pimeloyl-ACP methyl ester carboxylesterase
MSDLRVGDATLYYEVHGRGRPFFFVHGASGSHLSWWQQVPFFRERYTCVIYDQRDFGKSRSDAPEAAPTGAPLCRDIEGLVEGLGYGKEKVILLGSSLGSLPALSYAADHPDRVAALILAGGFGGLTSPRFEPGWKMREEMFGSYAKTYTGAVDATAGGALTQSPGEQARFAALYRDIGPIGGDMIRKQPALAFLYAELAAAFAGPAVKSLAYVFRTGRVVTEEETQRMNFPVLVIGGVTDPIFPPDELKETAACFPNAKHVVIADSGHSSYFDAPGVFNREVADFLSASGL